MLAELAAGAPARSSPLAARLEASRTAIGQTLTHLETLGFIQPNPGHGHPLRPAWLLTEKGAAAADWSAEIMGAAAETGAPRLLRRAWTLPVLRLLDETRRFADLRAALHPVTDRALTLSLKAMTGADWAVRDVAAARSPPQVFYTVGAAAAPLMPGLARSFAL